MKALFEKILAGTPLESPARGVYHFFRDVRHQGIRVTILNTIVRWSGVRAEIISAKKKALDHVLSIHGSIVAYGPFKGMQLSSNTWWHPYDLTPQILGVYEEDVLKKLCELSQKARGPFVDVGAADGYYAVGMAYSGLAEKVYAYEISEKGRESLRQNAQNNHCLDKVNIDAEADFASLSALISKHRQALILIDIEGAEFDLLSEAVLQLLKNCYIIVELHPFCIENGYGKQEALLVAAQQCFDTEIIERRAYTPSRFAELKVFSEDESLLALSESRCRNMEWLVMSPKERA